MTKCFFVTPTLRAKASLRRYVAGSHGDCSGPLGYHDSSFYLGDVEIALNEEDCWAWTAEIDVPHDDLRWPTQCGCGYRFQPDDDWQVFYDRIWTDGTRLFGKRELPVGAMFYVDYLPRNMYWDNKGDDHLHVITPGGEWNIDSRASNCTMPDDRLHRCWVRHGSVPDIHVDKNGHTCQAGAGSIACGSYHGFLHNGNLT